MMVDVQYSILCQMLEILLIGIRRLEIGCRHSAGARCNTGTGVITEYLNNVILVATGSQITASLSDLNIHLRVMKEIAYVLGIFGLTKLNDRAHQLNTINMARAIHERCFDLLPPGTADDQHFLVCIPFKVMGSQYSSLPKLRPNLLSKVIAQILEISVKLIESATLCSAIVGDMTKPT